jgi:hypothetical protein
MQYWLKVAGTGKSPISDPDWYAVSRRWGERHGFFSGFPKRPNVEPGDRLVVYAAGSGRVFGAPRIYAVEEVLSEPEPTGHDQWGWGVQTRLVIPGPLLHRAPTLHQIDVDPKSVRSHSHIRLTAEQGSRAEAIIGRAAERYGTPAKPAR